MRIYWKLVLLLALGLTTVVVGQEPKLTYVKKATREDSLRASLEATGLPGLSGKWWYCGPFDNDGGKGFDEVYPPEKEAFDTTRRYFGKNSSRPMWKEADFPDGKINNLALFDKADNTNAVVYLHREIATDKAVELTAFFGSDDGLAVWLNGEKILSEDGLHPCTPDQFRVSLKLKAGKNRLLLKVTQAGGEWAFYFRPGLPDGLMAQLNSQLDKDFPPPLAPKDNEARYYRIVTLPVPKDCVLEVGGMEMTPDGRLMVCTRRGEIWVVHNPMSEDVSKVEFKLFARGLHEPLGLRVEDDRTVVVIQRPELTRIRDTDGDGMADSFETICDKWGVSGDYHEFSFLSPRYPDGSYVVALNVGFGGGHQAKSLYRGWALRITAKGDMIPIATGLRSPNGLALSPEGDLFYADNQGEWVASCKLHHIREGEFYGHQAGLKWVDISPFKGKIPDKAKSGMPYDGQPGKGGVGGMPPLTPPVIWFPYGKMSQSNSEPIFDTTAGKFGPFTGQMINGDQTKSNLMRVFLEKVDGRFQGACFHLRSGFECGVNRLCWGKDGSLFVGMTNRGWGSVGPKPYGLQRVVWTGEVPMELHKMPITPDGWELHFTKPLAPASAGKAESYRLESYTYNYWSTYGSPEVDRRPEKVTAVELLPDGKSVRITVPNRKVGRVYELLIDGITSKDGEGLLHKSAWYTVNHLPPG